MALKHAILALLKEKEHTGYEIKDSFDGPLELMWSASYGGIYPALHTMEQSELITKETIVQHGKPNKMIYKITPKGAKELQNWLQKPPLPESVKDEFLLKMYLTPDSDPIGIETLLAERKERSEQKIALFTAASAPEKKKRGLFVDYNLHRYMSELRWITDALRLLKTKNKTI